MNDGQFIASMFRYKAWANEEMLAAIRLLDEQAYPDDHRAAIYLLNHTYIVDQIFAAHLEGRQHEYTAVAAAENPAMEVLSRAIKASDEWYVGYVTDLQPTELAENIDFTFTDGAPGRMSRAEILAHVLMHGGYHRGAIGRVMARLSIAPPRDTITGFLHKAEPAARRRTA